MAKEEIIVHVPVKSCDACPFYDQLKCTKIGRKVIIGKSTSYHQIIKVTSSIPKWCPFRKKRLTRRQYWIKKHRGGRWHE